MLKHELAKRNLPPLKSREEMIEIMQREVYGYLPENNFVISVANEKIIERRFNKGTVFLSSVDFTLKNRNGSHTLPVYRLLHQDGEKHPVIICINFDKNVPDKYFPIEELSETEYDIITYCYTDITSDDGDFTTGIAPLVFPNGRQNDTDCGKIGLWAFANMRVLDYVLTLDGTDEKNIAILGHSRLGKTALFTGMLDERFAFTFLTTRVVAAMQLHAAVQDYPTLTAVLKLKKNFAEKQLRLLHGFSPIGSVKTIKNIRSKTMVQILISIMFWQASRREMYA